MTQQDELTVWLGATRYYLGRMSASVSAFCDALIKAWPNLSRDTQFPIAIDIEEAFTKDHAYRIEADTSKFAPLGMDCDRASWERVRKVTQTHW